MEDIRLALLWIIVMALLMIATKAPLWAIVAIPAIVGQVHIWGMVICDKIDELMYELRKTNKQP